jgi:hypothetical protein
MPLAGDGEDFGVGSHGRSAATDPTAFPEFRANLKFRLAAGGVGMLPRIDVDAPSQPSLIERLFVVRRPCQSWGSEPATGLAGGRNRSIQFTP